MQQEINEIKYPSLFSQSKIGNLIINTATNTWYDSSTGKSGDTISLVTSYLKTEGESYTIKDACRWIENMCGHAAKIEPIRNEENIPKHSDLIVVDNTQICRIPLIRHIEALGFDIQTAQRYLKEIRIYQKQSNRTIRAIGLRNEDGGYYAFNPCFAGFVGKENITFIRGTIAKPDSIHIFRDIFDFLSAIAGLQNGRPFRGDAIILNSYAYLTKATPFIKGYGYKMAFSWLTNDREGDDATRSLFRFLKTEPNIVHFQMNDIYISNVNVYAWYACLRGIRQKLSPPIIVSS